MQRSGKQTVVQAEVVWTVEDNLAQVQQKQLPEPALMQPEPQQAEWNMIKILNLPSDVIKTL